MADSPLMTRKQSTRRLRLTGAAFFFLFFTVGVGVGIALLVSYLRTPAGGRHPSQLVIGILPALFILVGAIGTYGSLKKSWFGGGATTTAAGFTPAVARQETTLAPASRRKAFAFIALFTLLWNAGVSAGLYQLWQHRGPSVGLLVFLTPFVLIGLGLAVFTIYRLLGLMNPTAKIVVSSPAVAVGDEVTINWSIDGAVERLASFAIDLEAREEATYTRGTDTRTDRRVFASIPVTSASASVQRSGFTRVTIPADVMHSFDAPNNRIVWVLRVRGAISHWPDTDDEYRFVVSPRAL